MSSSHNSVTGYILLGGFIGGVVGVIAGPGNSHLPPNFSIPIAILAPIFGLIMGYMLAWFARTEQVKTAHLESQTRINESIAPQVVGKQCRDCNASIMFITDAHACPVCRHVVCVECEPDLPCSKCKGQFATVEVVKDE
ncbi:MAG: LytS/YehU family sensor histidine kinase [Mariniblastus sp.]|jgi:LytS/YehU family sensor histidine kinase